MRPRSTGRTSPRTISPEVRRRIGCRCGPTASMPRRASICGSRRRSPESTCRAGRSSSPTGARLPTTGCCWQPAPSRFVSPSRAPTSRTCTRCARSPTAKSIIDNAKTARTRGRHGCELYRARGRGVAPRSRHRGPCGGAGQTADGEGPRPANGRFHPRAARGARRGLPSRGHGDRHRRQTGEAQERRHDRGRSRGRRHRRAPAARARRSCRAHRSIAASP